eukprot:TRINITY_DN18458_c0_g1_i1.p1 TRINITY_DN18458_c0_g1~~TRINITY_DN18458_c0_g1_i1.p1  ORF type:complete len:444 (+),score=97.87 TRINITY_DN18458_c0_g1_i1:174-1505(+)
MSGPGGELIPDDKMGLNAGAMPFVPGAGADGAASQSSPASASPTDQAGRPRRNCFPRLVDEDDSAIPTPPQSDPAEASPPEEQIAEAEMAAAAAAAAAASTASANSITSRSPIAMQPSPPLPGVYSPPPTTYNVPVAPPRGPDNGLNIGASPFVPRHQSRCVWKRLEGSLRLRWPEPEQHTLWTLGLELSPSTLRLLSVKEGSVAALSEASKCIQARLCTVAGARVRTWADVIAADLWLSSVPRRKVRLGFSAAAQEAEPDSSTARVVWPIEDGDVPGKDPGVSSSSDSDADEFGEQSGAANSLNPALPAAAAWANPWAAAAAAVGPAGFRAAAAPGLAAAALLPGAGLAPTLGAATPEQLMQAQLAVALTAQMLPGGMPQATMGALPLATTAPVSPPSPPRGAGLTAGSNDATPKWMTAPFPGLLNPNLAAGGEPNGTGEST